MLDAGSEAMEAMVFWCCVAKKLCNMIYIREKLRREMKSLYEETYWCPPRFLGVLRDNTLKNLI